MEEGLIATYQKRLKDETNPSLLLTRYYLEIHQLPSGALSGIIPTVSKLVRLYGRDIVFYAVTSTADFAEINHTNIYKLLSYLCKRHSQETSSKSVSLEDAVKALNEQVALVEISEVRSPFDE